MTTHRATADEIGMEMTTTEHGSRIDAIFADQENSGWVVVAMHQDERDPGTTITEFRSDRGHKAISAISESKASAEYAVQSWLEAEDE